MSTPSSASIAFGTDGWRAIIGRGFTFDAVFRVALATGRVWERAHSGATVIVGYDTRFQAQSFALEAARALAACGLRPLVSDRYIPTPGLCYSVAADESAIGGVQLTASHNPAEYLGFKVRMQDGGASPIEFTALIEEELARLSDDDIARARAKSDSAPKPVMKDFMSAYLDALYSHIDTDLIERSVTARGGWSLVVDPLYGAGQGYLARCLSALGIDVREIHGERNPGFGGLHPEPIPPWTDGARASVLAHRADAAFVTDGDADRIGAIDETGAFVSPHKIIALVAQHLVEDRHQSGRIVKTLSTSTLIDRLGRELGCEVTTTPIGFKWIYAEMLKGDVLIGGEESGGIGLPAHVRERDGLLMALLLTEMMAQREMSLKQLVDELEARVGAREYRRVDLKLTPAQKEAFLLAAPAMRPEALAGLEVFDIITVDGVKFILPDDQWLLLRPSGTEPLVRVYAEALDDERLEALLSEGTKLVVGEGN